MASSEDDKAPPTPSTLESVTEKTEVEPVEDRTSDKLSDEGLGTSEVDRTEEEKLNEIADASNEDLASGPVEPAKDLVSQEHVEPKEEETKAEEIPPEPVALQSEGATDTAGDQGLVTDGGETVETLKEMQEGETEEEHTEIVEVETDVKEEEETVAGTEELQPEDELEKTEATTGDVTQVIEENAEAKGEIPQHKGTGDAIEAAATDTGVRVENENIESNSIDCKLHVDESSSEVLLEKETIEVKPQEKPEAGEEAAQDGENKEDYEMDEQTTTEATNGVSSETTGITEVSEQAVPSEDVPVKAAEEKATHADESTSQDAVSVPESEIDSETKTEQGSPAAMKPDMESDSGSSSAADTNSVDLNLSISSFLSKSKEGGSVSMQVMYLFLGC